MYVTHLFASPMPSSLFFFFPIHSFYIHRHHHHNIKLPLCTLPFFPLTYNLSIYPSLQVAQNPNLRKLCASKLVSADQVCIGKQTDQSFLDADLSKLARGRFGGSVVCFQGFSPLDAPTVCGPDNGLGLFSSTILSGCPSNACRWWVIINDAAQPPGGWVLS